MLSLAGGWRVLCSVGAGSVGCRYEGVVVVGGQDMVMRADLGWACHCRAARGGAELVEMALCGPSWDE